jgi:hypothetical protein
MALWLIQGVAVEIKLGSFVDATDGSTPETALTITPSDVQLSKNAGAWAAKNDANNASHGVNGVYDLQLNATDTNTLGILEVSVRLAAARPVTKQFMVVPATTYLALIGGSLSLPAQVTGMDADVVDASALASDAVAEIQSGLATSAEAADLSDRLPAQLVNGKMRSTSIVFESTATGAGTTTTLVDSALTTLPDDHLNGLWIEFTDGSHEYQVRQITDFVASTGTITFSPALSSGPGTVTYSVLPAAPVAVGPSGITSASFAAGAISEPAVATNTLTAAKFATNCLTSAKIAADAIGASEFAADAANKVADHVLRRSFANARTSSDGDAVSFRSLLGGLAKLVNRWRVSGSTLTVYQEDDATALGAQTLTGTAGADPITEVDTT